MLGVLYEGHLLASLGSTANLCCASSNLNFHEIKLSRPFTWLYRVPVPKAADLSFLRLHLCRCLQCLTKLHMLACLCAACDIAIPLHWHPLPPFHVQLGMLADTGIGGDGCCSWLLSFSASFLKPYHMIDLACTPCNWHTKIPTYWHLVLSFMGS